MVQHYTENQELNEDLNTNNQSFFDIKSIINFVIDKYKQIILLLIAILIILVVDHITYYNSLFYSIPPVIQGQPQTNTLKKKSVKNKK